MGHEYLIGLPAPLEPAALEQILARLPCALPGRTGAYGAPPLRERWPEDVTVAAHAGGLILTLHSGDYALAERIMGALVRELAGRGPITIREE